MKKVVILSLVEGAALTAVIEHMTSWPLWLPIAAAIALTLVSWILAVAVVMWRQLRQAKTAGQMLAALDQFWPPDSR